MSAQGKPPLKDRLIPWYFVMAFGVVFAVNMVFVTLALQSNTGVVTENPYEKGLAYNQTIAKAKRQEALGWSSKVRYDNNQLSFHLKDKAGTPLPEAKITAFISRPLDAELRRNITLNEVSVGNYSTHIVFPYKGQWDVTVSAIWNNQQYQTTQRLIIR